MDARLLRYFNQELRYLREQGAEFAQAFPKIASRLGIEGLEVTDPYVERLLEGCAFLAARVQLKQDAEFPRLSHRLLELIYPGFLAPVPSMMIVQVTPEPAPNLMKGVSVSRDALIRGPATTVTGTRCEFRTTQSLQLTPLSTTSAQFLLNIADLNLGALPLSARPRCAVRVQLTLPAGLSVGQLQTRHLRFFLGGQTDIAMQLCELLQSKCLGALVGQPGREGHSSRSLLPASAIRPVGYDTHDAILPASPRGLSGVRLLQEYLAFPERFLFFDLEDILPALKDLSGQQLELVFLFSDQGQSLEGAVHAENFQLHCVPAVNLFPMRADRIPVNEGSFEFHVVPDRTRPLDFEVYDLQSLTGHDDAGTAQDFEPLFSPSHSASTSAPAYFTMSREPRLPSEQAKRDGPRTGYIGTECFVQIVDPNEAPYSSKLKQLSVQARCTNRDLPILMPTASSAAQGTLEVDIGLSVSAVRTMAGPTRPATAMREGGVAWRLLNLLSLNYLSLVDTDQGSAVDALRDLLSRFPLGSEPAKRRQIDAIQGLRVRPVVRRHPTPGPIAFSRGVEVELSVDELGFEGGSAFLFGAAMHHYLGRHASMNSFVETVLVSLTRGEIARWRPSIGLRAVL